MRKRKLKRLPDRDLLTVAVEFLFKMNKNKKRIKKLFNNDKAILDYLKKVPIIFFKEDEKTMNKNHALILYTACSIGKQINTKENVITWEKYLKGEPLDEPSDE